MSTEARHQKRTNPPGNNDGNESDEDYQFSDITGRYRARVKKYDDAAKFPTASTYQEGEEVYLQVSEQQQPAGPYIIVAYLGNEMYTIKKKDNGIEHPTSVSSSSLLVKY